MVVPMGSLSPHRRIAAISVVAALVLSACSDSDSASSGAPDTIATSSTIEAASTSTAAATTAPATTVAQTTVPATTAPPTTVPPTTVPPTTATVAPATTTSTTAAPTCTSNGPVPGDALGFETVVADFDLDGLPDQLITYFSPSEDRFHIRLVSGIGGSYDEVIAGSSSAGAVRPIGAYDIDSDGPLEAFVLVGSGASAQLVGIYDVAQCSVTRVTLDGEPAVFAVGATVGSMSGMSCQGVGHIDANFASAIGGDLYEGGFSPHNLSGSTLIQGFGDGGGWDSFEEAAEAVATFDCPPLTL